MSCNLFACKPFPGLLPDPDSFDIVFEDTAVCIC